jgi:hypothetical protein
MTFSFQRPRPRDIIAWCLLAAAVIFAVYVRVRLREFPLERDEGEFAYAGQLMLQGIPPYKLAYNMKLPGTYMAYAALMAVFGQSIAGVHLGLLAVNVATIFLLYRLTRELFDPISAGLAAIFFAITSVSPGVLGMAAHATHFVAFFGVAGVWLLWRYLQCSRWWLALGSGLLLGTAFLMKQQGVFLMVFGGAVVAAHALVGLVSALRGRSYGGKSWFVLALQAVAFCAAAVLPYLLVCLWLWRAGVFKTFWFWTVRYAQEYVAEVPLQYAWLSFWQGEGGHVVASERLVWLLMLAGIAAVAFRGRWRPGRSLFVLGFLVFSFLCICPGFFFRSHYFIAMLPAVAMLAGIACGEFLHLSTLLKLPLAAAPAAVKEQPGRRRKPRPMPEAEPPAATFAPLVVPAALVVAAAVIWPFCAPASWPLSSPEKWYINFELPAELACRLTYTGNPFVEAPVIAAYLEKNMTRDDTVAVLGSEPEIPFYSRRHSATGYIYTYGLMEAQPLAPKMQKDMIDEIEKNNPKYILVVDCRCSWLYNPGSCLDLHKWANRYLREKYEVVGLIERPAHGPQEPPRAISYRWSESKQSETPLARAITNYKGQLADEDLESLSAAREARAFTNDKGQLAALVWRGKFDGYQPNPFAAECAVWVCRRK